MKKILVLFVLAAIFMAAPHEASAQKIKKPEAKTDPYTPTKQKKREEKGQIHEEEKETWCHRPQDFILCFLLA